MRLGPIEFKRSRLGVGVRLGRFGAAWLNKEGRRYYLAADTSKYSDKFRAGSTGALADAIIQRDGATLRKVGNHLVRNEPKAAAMTRKRALRASGCTGPIPRLRTRGGDSIERLWRSWGRACSLDGELSWPQLCHMLLRCEDAAGEAFVFWTLDGGDFRVAPFEADQLAGYLATRSLGGGRNIHEGIEYDPLTGRKLAYWFASYDPAQPAMVGAFGELTRLEASRVAHLYDRERPTQTRGVSLFAQVANAIADRGEARAAHLQVGKIAAYMGVFIHTEQPANGFWSAFNQEDSDGTPASDDEDEIRLEPGSVNVLGPNERASFLNAKTPDLEFQQFDDNIVREMAVHADLPPPSLTGDYASVNYSSARMAARDNVMAEDYRRARFEAQVATPVFRAWLQAQALAGRVNVGQRRLEEIADSLEWAWPPRPYHDPKVEVEATIQEVYEARTLPWSEAVASRGADPEQTLKRHADDIALFAKYGVPYGPSAMAATLAPPVEGEVLEQENNAGDEEPAAEEATA